MRKFLIDFVFSLINVILIDCYGIKYCLCDCNLIFLYLVGWKFIVIFVERIEMCRIDLNIEVKYKDVL